jgi:cytochrome bd-type quinol oxidase subunit 1
MPLPETALLAASALQQPDIHVPVIGNRWAVGGFFLLHIVFGSFTMGTLAIGPTYELVGWRRRDPRFERYARALADVNIKIFSLGATLAGFAVIFLTGLYPRFLVQLLEIFWWPALAAFVIWLPAIAALYTYVHWWDRMADRPGRHLALGYTAAALDHVFLVLIVGIDSYLLTPGGSGLAAFFNPSFLEELGHRFNGNISWASFFIAAVAAVFSGTTRRPDDRAYFQWAAKASLVVGFLTLILQVLLGVLFVESIHYASPGAFAYSFTGPYAWLWLVQLGMLSVLVAGSSLYFWLSRPNLVGALLMAVVALGAIASLLPAPAYPRSIFWARYIGLGVALAASLGHWLLWRRRAEGAGGERFTSRAALAVTGVTAVLLFLLMGVIRTTARDDYTIYGKLRESDSYGLFQPGPAHYP